MYYPIYLEVAGMNVVVIGGGTIAERKVLTMVEYGAKVTVISPNLTNTLNDLVKKGTISYIPREYQYGDLKEAFLVVGATDKESVNEAVSKEGKERGILCNIVDDIPKSNYIVPSIVQQGDLQIAISTNGKSPAMARVLKEQLRQQFGPEYAIFLSIMGEIRNRAKLEIGNEKDRAVVFEEIVASDVLDLCKEDPKRAEEKAFKILQSFVERA